MPEAEDTTMAAAREGGDRAGMAREEVDTARASNGEDEGAEEETEGGS